MEWLSLGFALVALGLAIWALVMARAGRPAYEPEPVPVHTPTHRRAAEDDEPHTCLQCGLPLYEDPDGEWACPGGHDPDTDTT